NRAAALTTILGLMPYGAAVAHGSSVTLQQIGLVEYLSRSDSGYRYLNAEWLAVDDPAERYRVRGRLSLGSDYYLGGLQAVAETGEAIGSDYSGSRQAFYVFGPPHVIWV